MKNDAKKEIKSFCGDCPKMNEFSFKGCARSCNKMLEHLKIIFSKNCSPCLNFRCDIPGVDKKNREKCEECPLPEVYSKRLGIGPKSALGKEVVPPPDGFYKQQYRK